jgi:hypothetical protein
MIGHVSPCYWNLWTALPRRPRSTVMGSKYGRGENNPICGAGVIALLHQRALFSAGQVPGQGDHLFSDPAWLIDRTQQDRFAEGVSLTLIEEGSRALAEPENYGTANLM